MNLVFLYDKIPFKAKVECSTTNRISTTLPSLQGSETTMQEEIVGLKEPLVMKDYKKTMFSRHNKAVVHRNS